MSSPPPQNQQQQEQQPSSNTASNSGDGNAAAAAAALAAASAMKQASAGGVVRICGTSPSECGYCKGSRAATATASNHTTTTKSSSSHMEEDAASKSSSSKAYSLLADFITPQTYEGFLYRGWRRSGIYLYKPNNFESCCPAMTIRLPVRQFHPTKSQRKVVKKMDHLLCLPPTTQRYEAAGEAKPSASSSLAVVNSHNNTNHTKTTDHHLRGEKKRKRIKHADPGGAGGAGGGGNSVASSIDASSSSIVEQIMQQGKILEQLQEWTQPLLQSILQDSTMTTSAAAPEQIQALFTKAIPVFKVKPPQGKKNKQKGGSSTTTKETNNNDNHTNTNDNGMEVSVCTTICAALAGQSKGVIHRDVISQQLTQKLQDHFVGKTQSFHPNSTTDKLTWAVQKVHRHAKSGQVFCDLQLPSQEVWMAAAVHENNSNSNVVNGSTMSDDASMQDANSPTGNNNIDNDETATTAAAASDKLALWMQEHGPSMEAYRSRPSKPDKHDNNNTATTTTSAILLPSPPYAFAVETLPAHQSAMNPEVHKLYFLYQHLVHQDADPFTCDLSGDAANSMFNSSSNSENMGMAAAAAASSGGDDGAGGSALEDDEWSTPYTSDGDNVMPLQFGANGELSPPPPPPAAGSSGGGDNRNPPGFIDTAKRMLQKEYGHNVSVERLKQITKSYGSFFQFLVESPFHLPSHGLSETTATTIVTKTPPSSALETAARPSTTMDSNNAAFVHPEDVIHLPCGTYHQQYRIAGMLVAVGVVDILPQGLSSVYLFYHPQFARDLVPLGKYAILQEIEFARSLQLPYYYLGYYIESCTKMRYKAEYRPSELLCPTSYRWVDALLAQRIIQAYSPVRHCCTLYYEDKVQLEHDLNNHEKKMRLKQDDGLHKGSEGKRVHGESSTMEANSSNEDDNDSMSMDDLPLENNGSKTQETPPPKSTGASSSKSTGSRSATKSILKKPKDQAPRPPDPHVERVKMDVGVGVPVTLSMLHERGRDTVRPLLEEFVKEVGPEWSQKCLVKFN